MAEENREEKLDNVGRRLLHAATAADETLEAMASTLFLYTKIRARVAEEKAKSAKWSVRSLLSLVARQAIPALALIALIAAGGSFFVNRKAPQTNEVVIRETFLSRLEQNAPLTACSIANRSECAVSTDDVVAILVNAGEMKEGKSEQ